MAQITRFKNRITGEIQYPQTVSEAVWYSSVKRLNEWIAEVDAQLNLFVGVYANEAAILVDYPNGGSYTAGTRALNTETDTYWIYDTDTLAWIDSFNKASDVVSVNGKTGEVTLAASDIEVTYLVSGISTTSYISEAIQDLETRTESLEDRVDVADLPTENPTEKYLRGDNSWERIVVGSGGYASNIYPTTLASTTEPTYYQLSYTFESAETEISTSVTSADGEKLLGTYIYDLPIETTSIDAGAWDFTCQCKVDSNTPSGTNLIKLEFFMYEADTTETVLFSTYSDSINNTDYAFKKFETLQPSHSTNTTDKLGVNIYVSTTRTLSTTISYKVGDGYASYFNTPQRLRHSQLRDKNEEDNYQHITQEQKDNLINNSKIILTPCDLNDLKGTAVNPEQEGGTSYANNYILVLKNQLADDYLDTYKHLPERYEIPQQIFGGLFELSLSYVPALNTTYQYLNRLDNNNTATGYVDNLGIWKIARTYDHTTDEWSDWETFKLLRVGTDASSVFQTSDDNSYVQKLPIALGNQGKGYFMNRNYELNTTGTPYTGLLFTGTYVDFPTFTWEIYVEDDGTNVRLYDDSDFELYNSTDGWLYNNVYSSYRLEITAIDDSTYPNAATIISYFSIGEIISDITTVKYYKENYATVTLSSTGWSANEQTVTVTGIIGDESQVIEANPTLPKTNKTNYVNADIDLTAEGEDSLTFTCETEPTEDITVFIQFKGGV